MNTAQHHPMEVVELAPELLQPLNDALTEEQHREIQSEQERKMEEEKAAAEARAAEAAEAERIAALREQYETAVPDELKERVTRAVEQKLEALRIAMEERFQQQHQALLDNVASLESKIGLLNV